MTRHIESHLQQVCVKWFKLVYKDIAPLLFAVPNASKRGTATSRRAKAEGLTEGVSDLILLVPSKDCHGLCIEMKMQTYTYENGKEHIHKTYQEPCQKKWQALVQAQGYRYEIVRTFDEFKQLIEQYLQ